MRLVELEGAAIVVEIDAGHLGDENITVKSVKIVEVLAEEGLLLVKGPVPGSRNTLVKLMKE